MILPNEHLIEISRDSDIISGREGMVCLDRNERVSEFPSDVFQEMLQRQSSSLFSIYPDLGPLYKRLSCQEDLPLERLSVGAGSDGLIRRVFQAFLSPGDLVLTPDPTYGMYAVWSRIFQANYLGVPYGEGPDFKFNLDDLLNGIRKGARLCCIANPDQPTGTILSLEDLRKIADVARDAGALLLIDEAYYPFHPVSARPLIDEYDNVVVLRTFSKVGGLAGLRIGFAMGDRSTMAVIQKVRSPGEVNSVGAAMACYLLENPHVIETFKNEIERSRELLIKAIEKLGFEIPVCAANFQLMKTPGDINPARLLDELANRGYLIKGGFGHSTLKEYVRVSLDVPSIIEPFIKVMEDAVVELRRS
ncbi:histidinol-phosphate transaminase [Terasakiella sp. A23]|uniref:pyridoxal phosphate-dependent aminotransferase n=1 Tax=Terasakiella sp. FCG-A23 TaxID=3080561 RepID=UPI002955883A|nr:histidinol-phosphate transaminase [Terasakiella sp. A23]MDV7340814.1 histidinol-phosphate transaminase [Terasakiella sp. A23]